MPTGDGHSRVGSGAPYVQMDAFFAQLDVG